jgi:hypothetical protein
MPQRHLAARDGGGCGFYLASLMRWDGEGGLYMFFEGLARNGSGVGSILRLRGDGFHVGQNRGMVV